MSPNPTKTALANDDRNLVLIGRNGLGKTMIAQNICHAAVLAAADRYRRQVEGSVR